MLKDGLPVDAFPFLLLLLTPHLFTFASMGLAFNATLPEGLLTETDTERIREFLATLIVPKVSNAFYVQVSLELHEVDRLGSAERWPHADIRRSRHSMLLGLSRDCDCHP